MVSAGKNGVFSPSERSLPVKENASEKQKPKPSGKIAGQGTKKDSATTLLFKTNNENFAELFNRIMPDEEQILPEDLNEEDIKETAHLRITKEGGGTSLVQYRDVVKSVRNGNVFAILGIENQSEIDYAMPFRVLELDFVNYARQVQIIRDCHEKEWRDERGHMHMPGNITTGEYLGRFLKEDRLVHCMTLVVYWGEEPWDGPKKLSDLFQGKADAGHTIQVNINLLDVCRMTEEEICRYTGELRAVFGFRKYAQDKKQLGRFIAENQAYFSNVSNTAVNALAELTHSPQLQEVITPRYQTKQGGFNMCKGLDGMIQDGIHEGEMKKAKEMSLALSAMGMSDEKIAAAAKVSVELVKEWLSESAG